MTMEGSRPVRQTSVLTSHIDFSATDFKTTCPNLDDPVVISVHIGELIIKKVLLDPGSSANVLFYSTFKKMHFSNNVLQSSPGELVGFSGEKDNVVGTVYVDHKEARQCYNASLKAVKKEEIPRIHTVYN
ncbi:uncharacterized protein LOC110275776 [Arachis duranensis]|uniref:Uncharacterized protein LOC110275776 n=1 Tax=Arachis duranensis TaxID=130453 RepID=A0A6P5MWD8_ARADU|nr:uncharacterized protein LOC110275776 [Arachis duranensis]